MFVDTSKGSIHWSPKQVKDGSLKWKPIRQFFNQQNKALFEILERRNFNAVHKSYHTLITGDIDDRGKGSNARGGKDDAIGVIGWWIRYHTRSGFKDRQKIKDIFNHAFGPFGDSDIQNTIDKLRELIPSIRRLGITLSIMLTLPHQRQPTLPPSEAYPAPPTPKLLLQDKRTLVNIVRLPMGARLTLLREREGCDANMP